MKKIKIPNKKDLDKIGTWVYTDGRFVYKFFEGRTDHGKSLNEQMEALHRVRDIPGVQRIVGYNLDEQALVTKFITGEPVSRLSNSFARGKIAYDDAQLKKLIVTLNSMMDLGVTAEIHGYDIIFNPQKGFTPIDYELCAHFDLGDLAEVMLMARPKPRRETYSQTMMAVAETYAKISQMGKQVNPVAFGDEIERLEWCARNYQIRAEKFSPVRF